MNALAPLTMDFAGQAFVLAIEFGDKAELRWIETSALMIDRSYQRDILGAGMANIRRIVREFKWSRFGALLVSDRGNGRFAVIDGQHRSVAALILALPKVPCLVTTCSIEEEALAFAALNGNITTLHPLQVFQARLVAGDREARSLVKLCEGCGVTIPRTPTRCDKPGMSTAIGTLIGARKRWGDELLAMALKAVVQTAEGNAGELGPTIINGLCLALSKWPAWCRSQAKLNAALDAAGIASLRQKAMRVHLLDGGSARDLFAAQVGKVLDKE